MVFNKNEYDHVLYLNELLHLEQLFSLIPAAQSELHKVKEILSE